jgi:hypothetical protein
MALPFLFQHFNRKSLSSMIHSDTTLVGDVEKKGMLPSGRMTHNAGLEAQRQNSFL